MADFSLQMVNTIINYQLYIVYTVTYRRQAATYLRKLPKKKAVSIVNVILELAQTGRHPKAKRLQGRDGWRIVIGQYRVIYNRIDTDLIIEVVKIGARGDVYK